MVPMAVLVGVWKEKMLHLSTVKVCLHVYGQWEILVLTSVLPFIYHYHSLPPLIIPYYPSFTNPSCIIHYHAPFIVHHSLQLVMHHSLPCTLSSFTTTHHASFTTNHLLERNGIELICIGSDHFSLCSNTIYTVLKLQ